LKILESEGPIQNQSQILSRPSNLTDSLGGGVDGGNVIDVIHYGDKSTRVCGGIKGFLQLSSKIFWVDYILKLYDIPTTKNQIEYFDPIWLLNT